MDQNVICCLFDNKELNTDLYSSIYTLYFAMYQNWGTVLVRVEIKSASNFRHINLKLCMVSPQSFKSVQLKIFVLLMFKKWYQICSSMLWVHFRNFDSFRRIADRAMRPKTTHKQFLMPGQWFQVNLSRFQGKWVSELLKTLCASVFAAWWSSFSMTLRHFFRWNRSECNINHCLDIINCLWSVCAHIVPWMINGVRQIYRHRQVQVYLQCG